MSNFALPNGIKIPESAITLFAEAGTSNKRDWEARVSLFRDFIKENPNKHLKIYDFGVACYNSKTPGMASYAMKRLIKEGRITRIKTRIKGKIGYEYTWHEKRPLKDPSRTNGPVEVIIPPRPMLVSEPKKSEFEINFDNYVFDFLDKHSEYSEAVVNFRNWIKKERQ